MPFCQIEPVASLTIVQNVQLQGSKVILPSFPNFNANSLDEIVFTQRYSFRPLNEIMFSQYYSLPYSYNT